MAVAVLVVKAIVVVAELEMERVLMTASRGNFMVVGSSSVSVGRLSMVEPMSVASWLSLARSRGGAERRRRKKNEKEKDLTSACFVRGW